MVHTNGVGDSIELKNLDVHLQSQRRGLQHEFVTLFTLRPHAFAVLVEEVVVADFSVARIWQPTLELCTIVFDIVHGHLSYAHGFDFAIGKCDGTECVGNGLLLV